MRSRIILGSFVVLSFLCVAWIALPGGASPKEVLPQDMDITHDGSVDSRDLIAILEGWGLEGVPTPLPESHPFQGDYQGSFVGPITGSVNLSVDSLGNVTGSAVSGSESIEIVGAISADGHFFGNEIAPNDTILATVIGTFSGDSGSGRWMDDEGLSGTWQATLVP
ncbi:MAG: hypothetical protein H6751_16130 [Candidatus Omnitrophica bacterium]|nr:hypothetical protein [Candidatus Omnitrophota bacterium]MCB9784493.1 hypothetical protein [Candidatus Omnitrophota bacterium]